MFRQADHELEREYSGYGGAKVEGRGEGQGQGEPGRG
jgi:hypothetical protein